jgi:hypothetical protein
MYLYIFLHCTYRGYRAVSNELLRETFSLSSSYVYFNFIDQSCSTSSRLASFSLDLITSGWFAVRFARYF